MNFLEKQFKITENNTTVKREIGAGLVTFMSMAYILAVIPQMLGNIGYGEMSILTSMVVLIFLTTVAMGIYTNRPFALAPGLGSVAIVTGMVSNNNVPLEIASGLIVISGILFIIITFLGVREVIINAIPTCLKFAVSAGIGLYIALIGARSVGLVVADMDSNSLIFGDLGSTEVILCAIGFALILILKMRNISGYMIIGILATTFIGIPLGVTEIPESFFIIPSGFTDNFLKIDIIGALNLAYIPFLVPLFIPDFFSTFGAFFGVGAKAGFVDDKGNFDGIDKCFKIDSIASAISGLFSLPCYTTYLESSVGVEAGGRTGLSVIWTSILFILSLAFSPIALMIPVAATAPALLFIGMTMITGIQNINFNDITEYVPATTCIAFTIFTSNIASGICLAIPVYIIMMLAGGRGKELHKAIYGIAAICILYFVNLA